MKNNTTYRAGLYCRLSKDDEQKGESASIGTQRAMLTDYCTEKGYEIVTIYVDEIFRSELQPPGISGITG